MPAGDGCEPVLPEGPCPAGLLAVPGESSCREIMACGAGKWGDIPLEPGAQYVDGSYAGGDSDGSEAKPWTSIQAAVDAAADGALVAVAEGTYAEPVLIQQRIVRLWGVCPSKVELNAPGEVNGVSITSGADGSEIHGIAVTGADVGFGVLGSTDILLDRVWVHDTAEPRHRGAVRRRDAPAHRGQPGGERKPGRRAGGGRDRGDRPVRAARHPPHRRHRPRSSHPAQLGLRPERPRHGAQERGRGQRRARPLRPVRRLDARGHRGARQRHARRRPAAGAHVPVRPGRAGPQHGHGALERVRGQLPSVPRRGRVAREHGRSRQPGRRPRGTRRARGPLPEFDRGGPRHASALLGRA